MRSTIYLFILILDLILLIISFINSWTPGVSKTHIWETLNRVMTTDSFPMFVYEKMCC